MVRSLTMLFNKIKNETNIPDKMRYKNVTALYKGKGPRMLLDSDWGIFTPTVLNCILQKLLLRDNYEEVDANLSDSNIGKRKKKNIRNNTFVMNSVIHDAITNNKAIDIGVYDYQKMFDSMNLCVTMNDVYDFIPALKLRERERDGETTVKERERAERTRSERERAERTQSERERAERKQSERESGENTV